MCKFRSKIEFLFLLICLVSAPSHVFSLELAGSKFNLGTDGWTMSGLDDGSHTPVSNGQEKVKHRDNALWGKEGRGHNTWYFVAPGKFRNDHSKAYGGSLIWSQRQSMVSDQFIGDDVILRGAGMTFTNRVQTVPGSTFTTLGVVLNELSGWRQVVPGGGSVTPTAKTFKRVLSEITSLWIRGEFKIGEDASALAFVRLQSGHCFRAGNVRNGQVECPEPLPKGGVINPAKKWQSNMSDEEWDAARKEECTCQTITIGKIKTIRYNGSKYQGETLYDASSAPSWTPRRKGLPVPLKLPVLGWNSGRQDQTCFYFTFPEPLAYLTRLAERAHCRVKVMIKYPRTISGRRIPSTTEIYLLYRAKGMGGPSLLPSTVDAKNVVYNEICIKPNVSFWGVGPANAHGSVEWQIISNAVTKNHALPRTCPPVNFQLK